MMLGKLSYSVCVVVLMLSVVARVGEMSVQASGGLKSRDPETYLWKPITPAELEQGIRQEGRDFFDLADSLCFYPVLQMSICAVF